MRSCTLLGALCSRASAEFYTQQTLATNVNKCILQPLAHVPHFYLRLVVRNFLKSFLARMPLLDHRADGSVGIVHNNAISNANTHTSNDGAHGVQGQQGEISLLPAGVDVSALTGYFVAVVYNLCLFIHIHVHPFWDSLRTLLFFCEFFILAFMAKSG